eukprot:CAMPEP_0185026592 /NCGR_PEP_ID=MMETSP1103-20130426/10948_1 /TAXON_ID=36769 /ORGANISM="Paraphysomonas bandaiensis, Strain Caron Lab Isolate" /LENGTH=488 /DNA_ID=CAMNT_0027560227 /DNA_START=1 /DNA_END=1467 /DNA_ORIENTATION=+
MFSKKDTSKVLLRDNVSPKVLQTKYDVRGEIYLAAVKRANEGKEVIYTNVGNPHALGEQPLTFNRQVLSLVMAPFLLNDPRVNSMYPSDAIARAREYLRHVKGGLGAYSDSRGNPYIRQEIADFIQRRDGVTASPDKIFVSNGASECVRMFLNCIIRGPNDGVMVPIPQYPLYSASIALYGGEMVGYYLDEDTTWSLDMDILRSSLAAARAKGITVRALVYINPGNPTGQCLNKENVENLLRFCHDNRMVLCADEVYQANIYTPKAFVSARKTLASMPEPYRSNTELVSFHSVSKGPFGECGLRGGYIEFHNIDDGFIDEMYKLASVNLSPNVTGQVALGLMVNPPRPGQPSHNQYQSEVRRCIESLKRRARRIVDAFNSMEGVSCQPTEGAMYSFPRIRLPRKFIERAKSLGKSPDVLYCLELLDETGLSCVPGSGFQQVPGTFHIRTTILPKEDKFDDIVGRFKSFHEGFIRRYGKPEPEAPRSRL